MGPLFSIITINYNNQVGLEKTLLSVVEQSSKNYELLIIDGGSSDNSLEIIHRFKQSIYYSVSEKDKGIYDAQNKGIEKARGEYLVFMNSGDCFANLSILEDLEKFITQNNNFRIFYGNTNLVDKAGKIRFLAPPEQLNNEFFYLSTLNHQSCFINKELFKIYGHYNSEYKICADYEFFLKVFINEKYTFKYINKVISNYEDFGISAEKKWIDLIILEKSKIQTALLSEPQLKEVNRLVIQQEGRKSKVFSILPDSFYLRKLYDTSYFYWYKLRSKG